MRAMMVFICAVAVAVAAAAVLLVRRYRNEQRQIKKIIDEIEVINGANANI